MNGGEERVNSVMRLCAWFCPELVGGEGVVEFCVYCQSGNKQTFKQFVQGVIEIYSTVGGRVSLVFSMSFVDGLHERELPASRLNVRFP